MTQLYELFMKFYINLNLHKKVMAVDEINQQVSLWICFSINLGLQTSTSVPWNYTKIFMSRMLGERDVLDTICVDIAYWGALLYCFYFDLYISLESTIFIKILDYQFLTFYASRNIQNMIWVFSVNICVSGISVYAWQKFYD